MNEKTDSPAQGDQAEAAGEREKARSAYSTPTLSRYGTISDLTLGGGGMNDDFPVGAFSMGV